MTITSRKKIGFQSGSAISEFVIIIPIFILILSGIMEFGGLFVEMSRASQHAYEVVRRGGEIPQDTGVTEMENLNQLLSNRQHKFLDNQAVNGFTGTPAYNTDVVSIEVSQPLNKGILGGWFLDELSVGIKGPYLRKNTTTMVSFETPLNPLQLVERDNTPYSDTSCTGTTYVDNAAVPAEDPACSGVSIP